MKKFFKSFVLVVFLTTLLVVITGCEKEANTPKKIGFFMSSDNFVSKKAVANNQTVILPDSNLTVIFWSDPSTNVDWTLSGPMNQTWSSTDQIGIKFLYSGTYTLNIKSLGVDWDITIIVSDQSISQVGTRFVGSNYSNGEFYYTFRINKPTYINQTDSLFIIHELAGNAQAPYLPRYTGISFIVPDSMDLTFSYPPSGNANISVKFIAGRIENGVPIWFNAKPSDPYKCHDAPPAISDIFQVNLKNGLAVFPDQSFTIPNASPNMGDYNNPVPVVLLSVNVATNTFNFWVYSLENPVFRYKQQATDNWTEINLSNGSDGYFYVGLPLNPASGQYIYDFGTGNGASFIQSNLVNLSSMYYAPYSALIIVL